MRTCLMIAAILASGWGCARSPADPARNLEERIHGVTDGAMGSPLAARMAQERVPGVSVAVIDDYDLAWATGHGVASVDSHDPVTPETLFLASSISKGVTSTVVLQLANEGLVDLDDKVNDRLVSWRIPNNAYTARAAVSLRQLLGHAACVNRPDGGFGRKGNYPTTVQILNGERPATNAPARVECLPGSELRYSNFGYVIVQQLIEDVTGESFPQVAQSTVLAPLGMASSTFEQPLSIALEDRAAVPHDLEGRARPRSYNPNAVAQGGLWTTPSDLARFAIDIMRAQAGRPSRVLTQAMTREMLTPQYRQLEGGNYWGLGFLVLGDWAVLQAGSDPGFRSLLAAFPTRGQGIVVMVNGEGGELLQLRLLLNFIVEYVLVPIRGRVVAGGLAIALLLSAVVTWPLGALVRALRRRVRAAVPASREASRRTRGARVLATLTAVAVLGTAYPYVACAIDPQSSRGIVAAAVALCAVLSLVLVFLAVRAWKEEHWSMAGRVHFSLVTLAAVVGSVLWLELIQLL